MVIKDIFEETYSALLLNKTRSGLTVLGIVIGIGSVIAMVSIGQGATGTIQSSIESLGSNLIIVMPGIQRGVGYQVSSGRGSAQTMNLADAQAIAENVSLVKAIAPELSGRYQVTAKGTNTNTQVVGTTADYLEIRNVQMDEGAFISGQNQESLSKVAVLGPSVRDDLFGENATNVIGGKIRIKGIEFKVIGITQSKGGGGFGSQDDIMYVPLSAAQRFLAGRDYLTSINIEAVDQQSMSAAQDEISALLLTRHKISDPTLADFQIMNRLILLPALLQSPRQ